MQSKNVARDDWFYIQQQKNLVELAVKKLKEDKELKQINIKEIKGLTEHLLREYIKS